MPEKGKPLTYSNRPGHSKYPIHVGYVFKLLKPQNRYNPKLLKKYRIKQGIGYGRKSKVYVAHTVYLWIRSRIRRQYGRQPRDRYFTVTYAYVPQLEGAGKSVFTKTIDVQKISIVRALREKGFQVISQRLRYNSSNQCQIEFYKKIGIW